MVDPEVHGDLSTVLVKDAPSDDLAASPPLSTIEIISSTIEQVAMEMIAKSFGSAGDLNNKPIVNEEKFECDICFTTLTSARGLSRHKRLHNGNNTIQCAYCEKRYVRRDQYYHHMITHVNAIADKEFACPCRDCGFKCIGYNEMRAHFSLKHDEEQLLNCKDCEQSFKSIGRIWQHFHLQHGALLDTRLRINEHFENLRKMTRIEDAPKLKRAASPKFVDPLNSPPKLVRVDQEPKSIAEALATAPEVQVVTATPCIIPTVESSSSSSNGAEEMLLQMSSTAASAPPMQITPMQLTLPYTTALVKDLNSFFICEHCGILFVDFSLYLMHNTFHSTDGNPFCCKVCNVVSRDRFDFSAHLLCTQHFAVPTVPITTTVPGGPSVATGATITTVSTVPNEPAVAE